MDCEESRNVLTEYWASLSALNIDTEMLDQYYILYNGSNLIH